MGKSSSEIQYDLERQRNAVEARIGRLQRRIRDDVETVGDEAKYDIDHWIGRESTLADRPKALVAGAGTAGVVLGMLSSNVSLPRPKMPGKNGQQHAYGPSPSEASSRQESKKKGLVGVATGAITGGAQGQINSFVGELWDSFKSGFKGDGLNDERKLPPDVRSSSSSARMGASGAAAVPGGSAAGHGTRYLSREEISPDAVDADVAIEEGDKSPREIMHDARAEDYAPRENFPAYAGVQGEGLLYPRTPGVQAPYEEEEHSERHSGQ